jgi:heme/copper-type cytochrome/quinol oxidase subunit 2
MMATMIVVIVIVLVIEQVVNLRKAQKEAEQERLKK